MKAYVLRADLNNQITTQGINARDDFSAKVLAVQRINANYVSDKRYANGEITLRDPKGKLIWKLISADDEAKKEQALKDKEKR